jgi:HD-GYP domain-containing protein (c-di-GMP phosphodiesterase class II)
LIPDTIIDKPGALDDEEWAFMAFMRGHTLVGERILAAAPALGRAARFVRSSHEAFDGSGYPDGLAGDEIPLGARIIAICDAFDAMLSDRPNSPAKTTGEALAELHRCAGTQFDAAIVTTFEQIMTERAQLPTALPCSPKDTPNGGLGLAGRMPMARAVKDYGQRPVSPLLRRERALRTRRAHASR